MITNQINNNMVKIDYRKTKAISWKEQERYYSRKFKKTLVNLLLRFYEPQSGEILIDGQNIQDVTQKSLRAQIGLVTQDTSLLHRRAVCPHAPSIGSVCDAPL